MSGSTTWSQLAGFAKKEDLAYFLHEICEITVRPRSPNWLPPRRCWTTTKNAEATGAPTRSACASAGLEQTVSRERKRLPYAAEDRRSFLPSPATEYLDQQWGGTSPRIDLAPELRWRACEHGCVGKPHPGFDTETGDDDAWQAAAPFVPCVATFHDPPFRQHEESLASAVSCDWRPVATFQ